MHRVSAEWQFRYTDNKQDRTLTLGKYGDKAPAMGIAAARKAAEKTRTNIEAGEDPRAQQRASRQPFSAFLDTFLKDYRSNPYRAKSTINQMERTINLLKSKLGGIEVRHIRTGRLLTALKNEPDTTARKALKVAQHALRKESCWRLISSRQIWRIRAQEPP